MNSATNRRMDERQLGMSLEQGADYAAKRWPDLVEAFERDSVLAKTRGVFVEDISALGDMLEQWEKYERFCESNGTLADLGTLPKHALEIITADFGTSIVPHLASVQPIKERLGIIYFKTVKALNNRGNVSAGDAFIHPFYPPNHSGTPNFPEGYAGEMITQSLATTSAGSTGYTGVLPAGSFPVRPRSMQISVSGVGDLTAIDDGNGKLYGNGVYGTIVYATGEWDLTFWADPGDGRVISASYGTDFEESGQVPEVNFTIEFTDIQAEIFALTQAVGMFKAFEFQNRFGQSSEEMVARDLTGALNLEMGNTAVSRLVRSSVGTVSFAAYTIPQYISYNEHMQQLKAKITQASSTILRNAGRGYVNYLICGATACGIVATLPGWTQQIVDTPGSNIWGTLDGMTVIRAPHINNDSIFCVYRGKGGFDTPLVWAPYMPLVVSKTLQDVDNILKTRAVAAVWGGLKVVAPTFVTEIRLTT